MKGCTEYKGRIYEQGRIQNQARGGGSANSVPPFLYRYLLWFLANFRALYLESMEIFF